MVEEIEIGRLKPAKYNPRKISEEAFAGLVKSIQEFGMPQPIVVNKDMTVIGGHQRLKAAGNLGWKKVPCEILDLDKVKEKALNMVLNNKHIEGEFTEELQSLLKEVKFELPEYNELKLDMLELNLDDINYANENAEWVDMLEAEWVDMLEFKEGEDYIKLTYIFGSEESRENYVKENSIDVEIKINKKNWICYK